MRDASQGAGAGSASHLPLVHSGKLAPNRNVDPTYQESHKRGAAMSGEQQLERSVLEAKERDELHTIAEALSLKPGSRTKKADLIDQILRATGVEVGEPPSADAEKPRRTRRTRTAPVDDAGGNGNGEGASADATPEA